MKTQFLSQAIIWWKASENPIFAITLMFIIVVSCIQKHENGNTVRKKEKKNAMVNLHINR